MAILWLNTDNLIRVLDLRAQTGGDDATPVAVTSATVTAQITDSNGNNVGSQITLAFVAGSDGDYEGVAADTLALVDGEAYEITVTADDGSDRRRTWVMRATALEGVVS